MRPQIANEKLLHSQAWGKITLLMTPNDIDPAEQPSLDELISLNKAAEISGFSTSFIRRLVSTGKIWGMKVGRNWVTTNQAIGEYIESDRKRGRKPKQSSEN